MKFGMDIYGIQRLHPSHFGDSLNFPVIPPAGQNFHLFSVISQHLLDGIALFFYTDGS